ncbi:MAG: PRC-barrel domain-containing protein [Deltaproteobacteria bacterium]|nr:PRC-barrel domain-containing protein [Deltaproteobacteria bacterium]
MPTYAYRQLAGKRVFTQDGTDIGDVEGFDIDTDTWTVVALEVKLERKQLERLNMEKPVFGSPSVKLSVDRVAGVSEAIILDVAFADLRFIDG